MQCNLAECNVMREASRVFMHVCWIDFSRSLCVSLSLSRSLSRSLSLSLSVSLSLSLALSLSVSLSLSISLSLSRSLPRSLSLSVSFSVRTCEPLWLRMRLIVVGGNACMCTWSPLYTVYELVYIDIDRTERLCIQHIHSVVKCRRRSSAIFIIRKSYVISSQV